MANYLLSLLLSLSALAAQPAQATLRGSVVDDNGAPVPSVEVSARLPDGSLRTVYADSAGGFELEIRLAGQCRLTLSKHGFFRLVDRPLELKEGQQQQLVGPPNRLRFPDYLSLNLGVERRFRVFGRIWAVRIAAVNASGHLNPDAVINNIDAADFLRFAGGQKRAFTARIRLVG